MLNRMVMSDRGASMVEYSLLVVLIAIAGLVAVSYFGDSVAGAYSQIADSLDGP
jgi:Flp pilus assembly pilin Flp